MTYNSILIERDAPVATITMNRPEKRNALSSEMMRELIDALRELSARTRRARHRARGQRPGLLRRTRPARAGGWRHQSLSRRLRSLHGADEH